MRFFQRNFGGKIGICSQLAAHGRGGLPNHEIQRHKGAITGGSQCAARLLHGNMRLRSDGWGMVNAAGCSEVGFWPLYFGDDYFILIVSGMPRFNQEAFTTLVWALGVRYGHTSI